MLSTLQHTATTHTHTTSLMMQCNLQSVSDFWEFAYISELALELYNHYRADVWDFAVRITIPRLIPFGQLRYDFVKLVKRDLYTRKETLLREERPIYTQRDLYTCKMTYKSDTLCSAPSTYVRVCACVRVCICARARAFQSRGSFPTKRDLLDRTTAASLWVMEV